MGPIAGARAALQAQRGQLFPFVPVFLGLGIGVYFCLRTEPPVWVLAALGGGGAAGLGLGGLAWRGLVRLLRRRGPGREEPGDQGAGATLGHGGEDAGSDVTGSDDTWPEERGPDGAEPTGGGRLRRLWRAAVPRHGGLRQAGLRAAALVALGLALAGARTHQVAGPVLEGRYYGPIQGRIVAIDRSASDALRLTLDRVVLRDRGPDRTPRRVRVSLHGGAAARADLPGGRPEPGAVAILTGHLSPPGGPVEPGGFDFRRHAWFLKLGAVGYTRTPVLRWQGPGRGWRPMLHRLRLDLSARIQQALPGRRGAFAAAVLTGDRSGMDRPTLEALRRSNLAHLLAISGLHMGLLAGFVFAALRLSQAALPRWCDRAPVKKIAALGALLAAAGYLALSGGNVATQRAFVMAAVALGAVLADRRALSLRAVALAALIVLVLRPEALLGPGFQMSFAATTALVVAFGALRDAGGGPGRRRLPGWARPVAALVLSSTVAGAATAPIAAAHFNILAKYGLLANLATVPLMGALVIPAGVLSLLLMPLGWEAPALWLMGQGAGWILFVAERIAGLEGAVRPVPSPGWPVLPLIAGGGALALLWPGGWRMRAAGLLPVAGALVLWWQAERPVLLVAEDGALVGVMTPGGRALSRPRGAGFAAGIWLENDGDVADQPAAAARWTGAPAPLPGGLRLRHLHGVRAARAFAGCARGELVVTDRPLEGATACEVYGPARLARTGSVAIMPDGRRLTAREVSGHRPWTAPRR